MSTLTVASSRVPRSALFVEPSTSQLSIVLPALTAAGFDVTVTQTFQQAKTIVEAHPPRLLITHIRLSEYNGLHLVLRGRGRSPEMAALVMSAQPDSVLQLEAERMGATFVIVPTSREEFIAAIYRTLARQSGDLPIEPIRPPFERRSAQARLRTPTDPETESVQFERRHAGV
jgi:DNA-binding NtrC family response regulator